MGLAVWFLYEILSFPHVNLKPQNVNLGLWILKLGINVNQELDEGWRNAKLCENLATKVVEVEISGLE